MSEPLSVALPDPFVLYRGGVLHQARIAYECWGELNAARDNAVLLFTGLSPSAHAAATRAIRRPAGGSASSDRGWRSIPRATSWCA